MSRGDNIGQLGSEAIPHHVPKPLGPVGGPLTQMPYGVLHVYCFPFLPFQWTFLSIY